MYVEKVSCVYLMIIAQECLLTLQLHMEGCMLKDSRIKCMVPEKSAHPVSIFSIHHLSIADDAPLATLAAFNPAYQWQMISENRKEKTTPFVVNLTRSLVMHQAAQNK